MSEQTGATADQIEAAAERHYRERGRGIDWDVLAPEGRETWINYAAIGAKYLVPSGAAVLDAAAVAAVARLIAISEYAQALLFLHGSSGMPWADYDGHGTALMEALENPILPHDWEVLRAFVAEAS